MLIRGMQRVTGAPPMMDGGEGASSTLWDEGVPSTML